MFSYEDLMGNRTLAHDIFTSTVTEVCYICNAIIGDSERADKIVCDLYKKIFDDPKRLDGVTDFEQWIKKAACVASIVHLRRDNPHIFDSLQSDPVTYPLNSDSTEKDIALAYETKMEALSPLSRCASVCYHYCKMTDVQIAKITNTDISFVRLALERVALQIRILHREVIESGTVSTMPDTDTFYSILCGITDAKHIKFEEVCDYPESDVTVIPRAHTYNKSKLLLVAVVVFVTLGIVCSALVFLTTRLTSPTSPTPKDSSISSTPSLKSDVSVADITSSVSSAESTASKEVVSDTKKEPITKKDAQYLFSENIYYNADGEKTKMEKFEYTADGKVKKATVSTPVYDETLTYKYSADGKKRTTVNDKGTTVETATFDKQGNVTSANFTKENVKFTWVYTYDKKGNVTTAKYSSVSSGKYTYKYDEFGRVLSETHTCDGDTFKTDYTYDDNSMVTEKKISDSDGTETVYTYTYDYDKLTYKCEINNGKSIVGRIKSAI